MRPPVPSVEQIQTLPLTHEETVSPEWLDVMGHMNVAYYTAMFSSAMRGFRTSLGLGNEKIKQLQVGTFAIETQTRYLRETLVDDQLQIHTRVLGRSKSCKRFHAMHFAVNVSRRDSTFVAATYEAIVAVVDLNARRMTAMPNTFRELLDAKIVEHQSLNWAPPVCGSMTSQPNA